MVTMKIHHSFPVGYFLDWKTDLTLENTNPIVVGMDGGIYGVVAEGGDDRSPLAILFTVGLKTLRREIGANKLKQDQK